MVLFTATRTGTFVVKCDLHPEHVGRLTVFDAGERVASGLSSRQQQALTLALNRDLGRSITPVCPASMSTPHTPLRTTSRRRSAARPPRPRWSPTAM